MTKELFVDPDKLKEPSEIVFQNIPVNAYQKSVSEARADFGDDELARGQVSLKKMSTSEQKLISVDDIVNEIN